MTDTSAASTTLGGRTAGADSSLGQTAKEEAAGVKDEAGNQAHRLARQVRTEVSGQASEQQQRAATGLRSAGDQLHQMAASSSEQGMARDLVSQAATHVDRAASWLGDRDPESLLEEVKGFARRKPGAFIAIAVGAGILAGRLTKSLASGDDSPAGSDSPMPTGSTLGSESAMGRDLPMRRTHE